MESEEPSFEQYEDVIARAKTVSERWSGIVSDAGQPAAPEPPEDDGSDA